MLSDKHLDVLHDHYKETFTRIREVEATRDRLFLWVIAAFALLCLEICYPVSVGGALGKLSVAGSELDMKALPFAALLDVSWVLAFAIGLRYCQTSTLVNRQYPYLHKLEAAISPTLGGGDIYQREGKNYLKDLPFAIDVTWIAYVAFFPIIVIGSVVALIRCECTRLAYPWYHEAFDALIGFVLCVCFVLYRMLPIYSAVVGYFKRLPQRRARKLP